jgi:hypothetical protein
MPAQVETEREVEAELVAKVRLVGGLTLKIAPIVTGAPDRLVILPGGSFHLVELKNKDGRLSPAQHNVHRLLKSLGAPVTVLWSKEEVRLWISKARVTATK